MSTILPPPTSVPTYSGLKLTMTVFGTIGMALWGTSVGFVMGWDNGKVLLLAGFAEYVTIIANAAMIYITSRLIFLVHNPSFPKGTSLQDLQQCVARLTAFTTIGMIPWVNSIVWLATYPEVDIAVVFHACNYGFVISAVVAGLAGGLLRVSSVDAALPVTVGTPKYAAPQGHYPPSHQGGPHAQYTNPAYAHHYQQRM